MDGGAEVDLKYLSSVALDFQLAGYLHTVAVAVLYYDVFLQLSHEIKLVWSQSWTLGTVIYFLNRIPLLLIRTATLILYHFSTHISIDTCTTILRIDSWLTILCMIPATLRIVLTAIAVWTGKRSVSIGLMNGLVATNIAVIACVAKCHANMRVTPVVARYRYPDRPTCLAGVVDLGSERTNLSIAMTIQAMFAAIVFGLIIASTYRKGSKAELLKVIFSLGLIAVTMVGVLFVGSFLLLRLSSHGNFLVFLSFNGMFISLVSARCSRSMLRLREQLHDEPTHFGDEALEFIAANHEGQSFTSSTSTLLPSLPE